MSKPQPLFILTCMRSFSSLVSTMLGQHPALYCLPEVNPFLEASIGASDKILRTVRPRTRDGLLRAIGQLEFGGQTDDHITQAEAWINARYDWTPVQLMGYFSTRLAPKIVIEKSPSTVLVRKAFDRALDLFPDAHYLHLYRHPIPTTKSIATITGHNGKTADRKRRANDPETSWYDVNAQIVEMTARLAPGQVMSVRGEDVLQAPDVFLAQICEWLGIYCTAADLAAMQHPERSIFASVGPASAPFGNDPNFLRNPGYSPRDIPDPPLTQPLDWAETERRLRPESVALAQLLGYGRTDPVKE